jgi:hypothetical protein
MSLPAPRAPPRSAAAPSPGARRSTCVRTRMLVVLTLVLSGTAIAAFVTAFLWP